MCSHVTLIVTDEDYFITSQFNFTSIPSRDCVDVDLLSDSSLEGCHGFTVSLNVPDYPSITTTGLTDILIEDTNGRSCMQQQTLSKPPHAHTFIHDVIQTITA